MLKRILRIIATAFFSCGIFVYTLGLVFTLKNPGDQPPWLVFALLDALMLLFIWLMWHKKKKFGKNVVEPSSVNPHLKSKGSTDTPITRQPVVSISTSSAPENVLRSMRNSYTAIQFEGDLRIFQDCVDLIQKTTNLDTFFSRYELGMQKALTMRQAEQAKFPGAENGQLLVDSFIQIAGIQRERVLTDSFEQEKIKIEALSTPRGRRNRWEKYLALLQEHETDFDVDCPHVYSAVVQYVEGQIAALASEKVK